MFGVFFNEGLLLAVVSPAASEPCPLDDVIGLFFAGDRDIKDDDFCFGVVFIGGVSSQLASQLSLSRDILVSCGLCNAVSS